MGRFMDGQLQFLSCIPNAMDTKRLLLKSVSAFDVLIQCTCSKINVSAISLYIESLPTL